MFKNKCFLIYAIFWKLCLIDNILLLIYTFDINSEITNKGVFPDILFRWIKKTINLMSSLKQINIFYEF